MGDGTASLIVLAGVLAGSGIAAIRLAAHATRYRGWQPIRPDRPADQSAGRPIAGIAVRLDQPAKYLESGMPLALPQRSSQP